MNCRPLSLFWTVLVLFAGFEAVAGDGNSCRGQESKRIQLRDGRYLGYREYGSPGGSPVLYFHGIISSSVEAGYIAQEIRRAGIRLIAIDRPGMGCSTVCPDRTILDWVGDVDQFLAALGMEDRRFGIIAVSGGAGYGCACAIKMPHRVSHLAIVSGYSPFDVAGVVPGRMDQQVRLVSSRPNLGGMLLGIKARQAYQNPEKVVKWVTDQSIPADRKMVYGSEEMHRVLVKNLQEAMAQGSEGIVTDLTLLRECWGFEVSEIKGVSVSIWNGSGDPIVTPSMARYFHRQIAGSTLTMGPNEGHATMLKNYSPEILRRF